MDKCFLSSADFIFVSSSTGEISLEKVEHIFYGGKLEDLFGDISARGPLSDKKNAAIYKVQVFEYRHHRFIYHPFLNKFLSNGIWKSRAWVVEPISVREGLSVSQRNLQFDVFGYNDIIIPEKSTVELLISEVLHPFYVFQIASVILWTYDEYIYYASCILLISTVSVFVSLFETKRNVRKIQEMAKFECSVETFRDGIWRSISSLELVPGDVISISDPKMTTIPCDAVVLEGNCITNESMLTGESVPVAKTPAHHDTFDKIDLIDPTFSVEVSKHVIFSGTNLIRSKRNEIGLGGKKWINLDPSSKNFNSENESILPAKATALVVRTGFNTTKGVLIRSILFPRQNKFKLYEDAFKFIGVLSLIAFLGFLASVANFLRLGISTGVIIIRALDLITVAVPPALPASMSIGTSFALNRLREKLIYCISPSRINVCGRVNLVGFDKTGTITEEGLDVLGIQTSCSENNQLGELIKDIELLSMDISDSSSQSTPSLSMLDLGNLNLLNAIATCHSINLVSGTFIGDPLDIKMFESTGWVLEEHDSETIKNETVSFGDKVKLGNKSKAALPTVVRPPIRQSSSSPPLGNDLELDELGIVKKFDFLPSLRRMSVIVRKLGDKQFQCYVKGAPETIKSLSIQSTIPKDFSKKLSEFTHNGYRVLAVGGKMSNMSWPDAQKAKREQIECELVFLGFVIFENKLKPTSEPVLNELKTARIRSLMCTGDNPLTAISVARQCNMVRETTRIFMPRLLRLNPQSIYDYDASFFNARFIVLWQDVDDPYRILDPHSLEPLICKRVDYSCIDFDASEEVMSADHPLQLVSNPIIDFKLVKSRDYALAITGDIFRHIVDKEPKEKLHKVLMLGSVYARMSPDEKGELMELLQEIGYCTAFCGDGANDCSALKSADIGISLSEAESSVAAPFTSKTSDIRCVLDVIKEGRASLVTSFSCFKYMACYSMIQFTSVSLLFQFAGLMGDFQFLFIDLFIIFPLSVCMARTKPYHKIVVKPPSASLMSKKVLTSLIFLVLICFFFQVYVFNLVKKQSFYSPPSHSYPGNEEEIIIYSYENTVLFMLSSFQYIYIGWVLSIGKPYRQSNFTNYSFVASFFILMIIAIIDTVHPDGKISEIFQLVDIPMSFRIVILKLSAAGFFISWLGEQYLFAKIAPYLAWTTRASKTVLGGILARYNGRYQSVSQENDDSDESNNEGHNRTDILEQYQRIFDPDKSFNPYTNNGNSCDEYLISGAADSSSSSNGDGSRNSNRDNSKRSWFSRRNSMRESSGNGKFSELSSWLEMGLKMKPINNIGKKKNVKPYKKILNDLGKPHIH
ncbi:putative cation-transporting ATPase [Smittium culicis]|uniref:Putative cation-transporting ATPase n=1 Tax=Smittium culicis TaxID=133412 RepID=A0A1R1Y878_9FUNG|nr:putative cation-transporting ATPase [Smittium culicis]